MTVLLIHTQKSRDGDSQVQKITHTLKGCNCAYVEISGLENALDLLHEKKGSVHTIIVDYDQVTEGSDFLKALSKDQNLKDVPLILYLSEEAQTHIQPVQHTAPYLLLQNPFTEQSLHSMVMSAEREFNHRRTLRREIRSRESVIGLITHGTFRIRSFEQAEALTTMLSLACPEPDRIAFGLFELLANAIEHGNLEITNSEKRKLMERNLFRDEIKKRLTLPEYKDRYVEITFDRESNLVSFKIADQGKGFDFEKYMNADMAANQTLHGRGISLARATSFDYLEYVGRGNKVVAITKFNGV